MIDPDSTVSALGETLTGYRIISESYNDWDEYDESGSTWESYEVEAVVSRPGESEAILFQGQEVRLGLRLTVPSGTDIEADRAGRPDQILRGTRLYAVANVHDDRHPWTGCSKLTVDLVQYPGRDSPAT